MPTRQSGRCSILLTFENLTGPATEPKTIDGDDHRSRKGRIRVTLPRSARAMGNTGKLHSPTVSKVGRAQIVRPPATAYVNPGGRGANFIPVGVEGIQEA
jgi:hypothetical protein